MGSVRRETHEHNKTLNFEKTVLACPQATCISLTHPHRLSRSAPDGVPADRDIATLPVSKLQ